MNKPVTVWFFYPKGIIECLISWWTAPFKYKFTNKWKNVPCHCGISVGDDYFDIHYNGYRIEILSDILQKDKPERFIKITKNIDVNKLFNYLMRDKKLEYDFSGVIHYIIPFVKQNKRRKYCSELVADALKFAGLRLKKTKIPPRLLYRNLKRLKRKGVI